MTKKITSLLEENRLQEKKMSEKERRATRVFLSL